jgi:hypothetical protein
MMLHLETSMPSVRHEQFRATVMTGQDAVKQIGATDETFHRKGDPEGVDEFQGCPEQG